MRPAIETHALTRAFGGRTVVDRVDLAVAEGTVFGCLGLNGAGKSTLIRMLCTLLRPTSGSASVGGHDVATDALAVRRLVALVGDEAGASRPSWSPREYVRTFARLYARADPGAATEAALDAVGLDPAWRARPIGTFSTGMKRRVELARALVGGPRVLFLDEPTRGLDLPAKRAVWDLLRRLATEEGVTLFVSSHEVAEILALCDELAVLRNGRIQHHGAVARATADPWRFEERIITLLAGGPAEAARRDL